MFTVEAMSALLRSRPFIPFEFIMSDGGRVRVSSPEIVLPFKHYAIVSLLDPTSDEPLDRWTLVWYMHVSRVEALVAGLPPGSQPPTSSPPSPAPVA